MAQLPLQRQTYQASLVLTHQRNEVFLQGDSTSNTSPWLGNMVSIISPPFIGLEGTSRGGAISDNWKMAPGFVVQQRWLYLKMQVWRLLMGTVYQPQETNTLEFYSSAETIFYHACRQLRALVHVNKAVWWQLEV